MGFNSLRISGLDCPSDGPNTPRTEAERVRDARDKKECPSGDPDGQRRRNMLSDPFSGS